MEEERVPSGLQSPGPTGIWTRVRPRAKNLPSNELNFIGKQNIIAGIYSKGGQLWQDLAAP